MAQRVKTVHELADALGIAPSTIYRWRNDGWNVDELFNEEAGGWDPDEVHAWQAEMKRARRKVLRPAQNSDSMEDGDPDEDWSEVWRKARAVKATLEASALQQSLVDRGEMERGFAMRVAELTTALDALSNQLAPRLAPLTRESEIQAELKKAFNELRSHFAR